MRLAMCRASQFRRCGQVPFALIRLLHTPINGMPATFESATCVDDSPPLLSLSRVDRHRPECHRRALPGAAQWSQARSKDRAHPSNQRESVHRAADSRAAHSCAAAMPTSPAQLRRGQLFARNAERWVPANHPRGELVDQWIAGGCNEVPA